MSDSKGSQNTSPNEGNYHSMLFKPFVLNYFKEVFHMPSPSADTSIFKFLKYTQMSQFNP